jgi:integrase
VIRPAMLPPTTIACFPGRLLMAQDVVRFWIHARYHAVINKQFVIEALVDNLEKALGRKPVKVGKAGEEHQVSDSAYVFTSERGTPFTTDAINRLVKTIGKRAGLPLPVHFHMLRHSCGYKLANDGIDTRAIQDWLGHVSITHTTRYT